MKKIVISLIIALSTVCLMAAPAAGATRLSRPAESNQEERLEQRRQILALRIQVLENRQEILEQADQNRALRQEARALLEDARPDLAPATLEQLRESMAQIKELSEALRRTGGTIRTISLRLRAMNPRADLGQIIAAYQEILLIQEHRLDLFRQINEQLRQLVELLSPAGA